MLNSPPTPVPSVPPISPLLARVLSAISQGHDQARLLHLAPDRAAMELGKAATLVLFTWDEAYASELTSQLRELMKNQHVKGVLVVGLVGGNDRTWKALRKARPMLTRVKVGLVHIDDIGEIRSRDARPVKKALADFDRTPTPSEEEWAGFLEQNAESLAEYAREAQTGAEFAQLLEARRPVATWTLMGLILAVFGLEVAFGGSESTPVLLRMGALAPERVLDGEIWRLFSCTFLHAGPVHLLFNVYVLCVLGTSLERVLGTARFLVLYGLSCLGGSLASLVFLDGFSVGASGGLWGLLGAEAVLAWRSKGLLPETMIPAARRATTFNLGINVLNSFRPHVDMWAHFGGGAIGAFLLLSGVLTRSLPRLGVLASAGRLSDADDVAIPTGFPIKVAAGVVAATLLLGLALGLSTGQPWALGSPIEHVRTDLHHLGVSLKLPKGLEQTLGPPEEAPQVHVGDPLSDPGAAIVTWYPQALTDPAELETELAALIEAFQEVPPGTRLVAGPEEVTLGGRRGLTLTYRFDNGIEEELALIFFASSLFKVDLLRWPVFGDAVPPGTAAKILESLGPIYSEYTAALRQEAAQGDVEAQNSLAWVMATCPDPAYLDGPEAVALALAVVAQAPDDPAYIDTLAASYARVGEFQKAIENQERALTLLSEENQRQGYQDRLALYKSGEVYVDD